MKRKYYLILSCMIALLMVGCNNNAKEKNNDVIETTPEIENQSDKEIAWKESITDESTTEPATEAPTQAPSVKPTEAPTQAPSVKPTEAPTQAPSVKPTEPSTEAPTQAVTEQSTQGHTEAVTTTDKTTYNPRKYLKINSTYRLYVESQDVQVWVYDIIFKKDGKVDSFLSEAYMLESSWQGEKTENYITYKGKKYYPVGAGGDGFHGTYSLTDEMIKVIDDNMYNDNGSIIFTMTAEGNIVVKSVNGMNYTRFEVGNEFILVQ